MHNAFTNNQQKSINGFHYHVSSVDDYSKFAWLYPIMLKSDVLFVFKTFKSLVESLFKTRIKVLPTDRGEEFINHSLGSFLQTCGILHQEFCVRT